jgi:extradiol dioxygenase family protein
VSEPVPSEQRVYTQQEFEYWLEQRTKDLREQITRLDAELKAAQFGRAVAEWAVAGVMSRQLSLRVAVDHTQQQNLLDMARALGANAGNQFLHAAELAFKDHAEFASLKMQCPPHVRFEHVSGRVDAGKYNWPRPYK